MAILNLNTWSDITSKKYVILNFLTQEATCATLTSSLNKSWRVLVTMI